MFKTYCSIKDLANNFTNYLVVGYLQAARSQPYEATTFDLPDETRHLISYLTAPLQLVYDLLLYGVYVVLDGVLWKEVVGTPGFVRVVGR